MAYGTKDDTLSHGKNLKITYHVHVPLIEIPVEVKKLTEVGLKIDEITPDNGMWRIDYYEIISK